MINTFAHTTTYNLINFTKVMNVEIRNEIAAIKRKNPWI